MAYIGNIPAEKFTSVDIQNFSVSATANYTLDRPVANENEIELFINNVRQHPGSGKAYTASGTALTLSEATAGTDTMYCVYQGKARQTVTPATSSVTNAMLAGSIDLTSKVTGALPQANIADQAINEAKLQVSNSPTNGYMLTAQSGNTGGLTWAEAASGGLVYVGGANVTSATTYVQVDNVFTSTYSNYLITYRLIPVTNGNLFDFQFRDGSSNTLDANEYEYTINGFSSNNVATYRDHTGDGKIRLTHGVNNNTSRGGLTGYMTVHEPDSGDRCVVHIHHMYPTDDASLRNGIGSGTYKNTGTAIAGFQFFGNGSTANDNTAEARIKVYGIVDS